MIAKPPSVGPQVTLWQIVILFLSVYVLSALLIETAISLPPETVLLLSRIDTAICFVFIGDFFSHVLREKNKLRYLKWGWIDLVSSIPHVQVLRWGRFVRVIRILRILRGFRSTSHIVLFLFANRAKGTFVAVSMISFVLMVFSSVAILNLEVSEESNIQTAGDALWWSFVTITTVGYGDYYPVSTVGRIVAALLMTAGVALFGTFTAYVASAFLNQDNEKNATAEELIILELQSIHKRLDAYEKPQNNGEPET